MGGCLGPKQRRQEVYIQMIQTIHEQVQQMTFAQTDNLDIYESIKQKLAKKGLLRKLIDNLISHRNKIYDSLNHNYEIVLQNSHLENKYAGLLIIDQIIEGIYQQLKNREKALQNNNMQSEEFTNVSGKKTELALQQMIGQVLDGNSKKRNSAMMNGNQLVREIDSRFDLIYFRLIIYLLQNVPKMYQRILKSIKGLCINKKGKFNCTENVWDVINFIMTRIIKQAFLLESAYSYYLLLSSTKENFKEYQKQSDVQYFISMWLKEQSSSSVSPLNLLAMSQSSSTLESSNCQNNLSLTLIKIVSIYFDTNISTWNSNFLYEIILNVYDQKQFDLEKLDKFEGIFVQIVKRNDLHVHFFRGLFVGLLQYLVYKGTERNSGKERQSGLYSNPQEVKWPNRQKKGVKLNAIKTLRRWVSDKLIDLNQTVQYNCNSLISCFLTNIPLNSPHDSTQLSKQFLKLTRPSLTVQSKQILISTLLQSIKNPQIHPRLRSLTFQLIRQLLEDEEIFSEFESEDNFEFIITIEEHYSKENQLEIVQLMGFVVRALPETYFFEKDQNQGVEARVVSFLHKIGEFLWSCWEVIIWSSAQDSFKLKFCWGLLSVLRSIEMKGNRAIVYAFYMEIIKELSTSTRNSVIKAYLVLYLAFQIGHIVNQQMKIPGQFKLINQKISSQLNSSSSIPTSQHSILSQASVSNSVQPTNQQQQLTQQIQSLTTKPQYTEPLSIKQTFTSKQFVTSVTQKYFSSPSMKQNLQTTCKIISSYFSVNHRCERDKNLSTKDQNDYEERKSDFNSNGRSVVASGNFGRRDSFFVQSENSSMYREEDRNLKDVLGILNDC